MDHGGDEGTWSQGTVVGSEGRGGVRDPVAVGGGKGSSCLSGVSDWKTRCEPTWVMAG